MQKNNRAIVIGASMGGLLAARQLIDIAWQIAVGSDLQHPRVEGKRTTQIRSINWYIAKLYRAAQDDAVLANRFLEVANLMRQPAALLDPKIAFRVRKGNRALARMISVPAEGQLNRLRKSKPFADQQAKRKKRASAKAGTALMP